jgi:hypothetical protein
MGVCITKVTNRMEFLYKIILFGALRHTCSRSIRAW